MPRLLHVCLTLVMLTTSSTVAVAPDAILRVEITDYADVSHYEIEATRQAVAHQFDRVGVHIDWRAAITDAPAGVSVVILSKAMSRAKLAGLRHAPSILGMTIKPARRVYIFLDNVIAVATEAAVPLSEPLSQAITHEIGHVLLPDGHADLGIMAPHLPAQGINGFHEFTARQGTVIRAAIERFRREEREPVLVARTPAAAGPVAPPAAPVSR